MIYIPTRSRPLDPWPSPLLKSLSLPPSFQPKYRRSGKAGRPPWQHSNTRPAIHKFVSIYARKLRGPVLSRPIVPRILQLFTSPISKEGSIEFSRMLLPTIRIINYNFYNWSNMEKYECLLSFALISVWAKFRVNLVRASYGFQRYLRDWRIVSPRKLFQFVHRLKKRKKERKKRKTLLDSVQVFVEHPEAA